MSRIVRDRSRIPTDHARVTVLTAFGDLRHLAILSSFLLKRYREESKGSKYFVLVSYPGFEHLFPYVDEYWSPGSGGVYHRANGFGNDDPLLDGVRKSLTRDFFDEVGHADEVFSSLYANGFKETAFLSQYKKFVRFTVRPNSTLPPVFVREMAGAGMKVFVFPCRHLRNFHRNRTTWEAVGREFWVNLLGSVREEGVVPVVLKHYLSHDLTEEGGCVHLATDDWGVVASAMRLTGCVLDVFSDIGRMAALTGVPFLCVDERARFNYYKESELDDLTRPGLQRRYVYLFPGPVWGEGFRAVLRSSLSSFLSGLTRESVLDGWGDLEVSYDGVRRRRVLDLGTNLLTVPKE
jgi:hypothetical protein